MLQIPDFILLRLSIFEVSLPQWMLLSIFVSLQALAPCCLFLAAKTEEQPRKLEHVLKVAHACLHRDGPQLDPKSEV